MHLILVSGSHAKARTITLGPRHLMLFGAVLVTVVLAFGMLVNHTLLRHAGPFGPTFNGHAARASGAAAGSTATNLDRMAVELAQMQGELLRLDTLGNRLARLAGFRPEDLMAVSPDRNAMREAPALPPQLMTLAGLTHEVNAVFGRLDARRDALGALESLFVLDDVRRKLMPTSLPLAKIDISSGFGWRTNPLTGGREFHEGIDFEALKGTPIRAAAAGVVVYSAFNPQYGNMIEIDHGDGLTTRYAHASERLVKVGEVVARGTEIGEVGSTGLATGNHLHFEVRRNGAPLNPVQFLHLRG